MLGCVSLLLLGCPAGAKAKKLLVLSSVVVGGDDKLSVDVVCVVASHFVVVIRGWQGTAGWKLEAYSSILFS